MSSLIEQLQQEALDHKIPTSELLRKAKVVAVKLDLKDFLHWIENELNGYKGMNVPEYRQINGQPKGYNPYHGWQPIMFATPKVQEQVSSRGISQAISELENLIESDGSNLQVPYPAELEREIIKGLTYQVPVTLFVSKTSIVGMVEAVRNIVLDWSLKLEKAGIKGEGVSFSAEDKKIAQEQHITYQINSIQNFTGNMGPMLNDSALSIQQINATQLNELKELSEKITKYLDQSGLKAIEIKDVEEKIANLKSEVEKEQPDASNIHKILKSIKNIFENVTGNIITQGILTEISKHIK